jgi:hypothetical protein
MANYPAVYFKIGKAAIIRLSSFPICMIIFAFKACLYFILGILHANVPSWFRRAPISTIKHNFRLISLKHHFSFYTLGNLKHGFRVFTSEFILTTKNI